MRPLLQADAPKQPQEAVEQTQTLTLRRLTQKEMRSRLPRRRRWRPKVKTGCRNCRARKVKCDENKPACGRCTKSNLSCAYIDLDLKAAKHKQGDEPTIGNQPVVSVSPSSINATDQEHGLFQYYLIEVADYRADTANRPLWAVHLPRAAKEHPAIWHACVSVAAMHQRQWFSASGEPDVALTERKRNELYTTSLRQYQKSLKSLINLTPPPEGVVDREAQTLVLGANLLFITGAIQRGEMHECVTHLRNGFSLIRIWEFWRPVVDPKSPHGRMARIVPNTAILLFYVQMDGLALESLPPSLLWPWQWKDAVESLITRPIASPLQALLEIEMIWIGIKDIFNNIPLRCSPTERMIFDSRSAAIGSYYQKWTVRLSDFKRTILARNSMNLALLATLEVRRIVVGVMFRVNYHAFETCWDRFKPEFEAALSLIGSLDNDLFHTDLNSQVSGKPGRKAPCSFTPSLTKSLYFIAKVCRASLLRRRAIRLFVAHRRRERIVTEQQDSAYFVQSTLAIMMIEEGAWDIPRVSRPASCVCKKGHFICNMHRVFRYGIVYTGANAAVISLSTIDDVLSKRPPQTIPVAHIMPDDALRKMERQ